MPARKALQPGSRPGRCDPAPQSPSWGYRHSQRTGNTPTAKAVAVSSSQRPKLHDAGEDEGPCCHRSCKCNHRTGSAKSMLTSGQAVDTEGVRSQTRAAVPSSLEASVLSPVAGHQLQDFVHVPRESWPRQIAGRLSKDVWHDVGGAHKDSDERSSNWWSNLQLAVPFQPILMDVPV